MFRFPLRIAGWPPMTLQCWCHTAVTHSLGLWCLVRVGSTHCGTLWVYPLTNKQVGRGRCGCSAPWCREVKGMLMNGFCQQMSAGSIRCLVKSVSISGCLSSAVVCRGFQLVTTFTTWLSDVYLLIVIACLYRDSYCPRNCGAAMGDAAAPGAVPEGGFKHPRTKCKIKSVAVPVATKGRWSPMALVWRIVWR